MKVKLETGRSIIPVLEQISRSCASKWICGPNCNDLGSQPKKCCINLKVIFIVSADETLRSQTKKLKKFYQK